MATKKRLIDANALVIEELLVMDRDYINEFASGVRKVMNAIRRLPVVDAVEVVHGRWIVTPVYKFNRQGEIINYWNKHHCSECKTEKPFVPPYNYCPNCGADMRERE